MWILVSTCLICTLEPWWVALKSLSAITFVALGIVNFWRWGCTHELKPWLCGCTQSGASQRKLWVESFKIRVETLVKELHSAASRRKLRLLFAIPFQIQPSSNCLQMDPSSWYYQHYNHHHYQCHNFYCVETLALNIYFGSERRQQVTSWIEIITFLNLCPL